MTADTPLIAANGSSTVVTTCTPTRAAEVSARFLCSPAVTMRGQRADAARAVPATPTTTVPVSSTRHTMPVARVAYHSRLGATITGVPTHDPPEVTTGDVT